MTAIANELRMKKDWIIIDLSPDLDLLTSLTAQLSNKTELLQIFKDAKINLSLFGFGVEIDGVPPVTDTVSALDQILEQLTKKGKKILITIDEVTPSKTVKEFTSVFQIMMRKNYNVFLIMTGLYENIYNLQNENTLTFLYRAPKVRTEPLNLKLIANHYMSVFDLDENEAMKMAAETKGYPFAYQLLGWLCFKNKCKYTDITDDYDAYLEMYVYEKIWSELSFNDKNVLTAIADATSNKVAQIRAGMNIDSNKFTVYRDRLIKKGILLLMDIFHLHCHDLKNL